MVMLVVISSHRVGWRSDWALFSVTIANLMFTLFATIAAAGELGRQFAKKSDVRLTLVGLAGRRVQ